MSSKKVLQTIGLTLTMLLLAGCGGALAGLTATSTPVPPTATSTPVPTLGNKQILLVIQERFNESEYGRPRAMLEKKGAVVTVASLSLDVVKSYSGGKRVRPDVLLSDVRAADYDAIVFVGGYPYDPDVPEMHRVAQEAIAEGKLVAGICNGVITLAKASVLESKRVTTLTYQPASELEEAGAILTDAPVERDGLIITGNGPEASGQFGEAIVAALEE
jgi:protease I